MNFYIWSEVAKLTNFCAIGSLAQAARGLDWTAPGCRPMATRGQGKIPAAAGLMRCALGGVGQGGGHARMPGLPANGSPGQEVASTILGSVLRWFDMHLGRGWVDQNFLVFKCPGTSLRREGGIKIICLMAFI